jgi:hypothetical protein
MSHSSWLRWARMPEMRAWFVALRQSALRIAGPSLAASAGLLLAIAMPSLAATTHHKCRTQRPQAFLERPTYVRNGAIVGDAHAKAIRYRVANYGFINGMGQEAINRTSAESMATRTEFFGRAIRVNRRIVPALQCVEERIEHQCTKPRDAYYPKNIGGMRVSNTIRGGEISNHLFGIAIDIDPDRNPCCHCVGDWKKDPKCAKAVKSPFERAALTHCWVDAFDHFGFYWLGRDSLEDTMHFEFLGDPKRILR